MIYRNIEFFNVGELEPFAPLSGVILSRIPSDVRRNLGRRAKFVGANSTGAEMRFVTDAENFTLYLASVPNENWWPTRPEVKIMFGNFEHSRHPVALDSITSIPIVPPNFKGIPENVLRSKGFAPNVVRVVCSAPSIIFCGLNTYGAAVRPPEPEEKPSFRCLCYGSSITNAGIDGWCSVMGQRLGIDVYNFGFAGACEAEPELADYIANRDDYDAIMLEIGVNMPFFEHEEYRKRVDYIVSQIVRKHPDIPVVMVNMFPYYDIFRNSTEHEQKALQKKAIFEEIYQHYKANGANLFLIDGADIVSDFGCLSADMLHPNTYGHAVMGLNFAQRLSSVFKQQV